MNQIIPPAWRTHLGDHAFEQNEQRIVLATAYGLK